MTSEIRINTLKNRVGLGTVSLTNTGVIVSGIITANSFSGPFTGDITGDGDLTLTSTDSGAAAAPTIRLQRDSSSPVNQDVLGQVLFGGKDSQGADENYASVAGKIIEKGGGGEHGAIQITTRKQSANVITANLTSTEYQLLNGTNLSVDGNITGNGNFQLTSTDTGSSAAPELTLHRNSASPADADYLGQIKFAGKHDGGSTVNYAKITGKILDASNGTEDGIIEFAHIKAGTQTITGRWRSDSLQLLNGTNFSVAGTAEVTGQLRVSDGSTSIPSVAAASDTNSGLYFPGADAVGLVAGGSRKLLVNSSGVTINNGDLAVNGGNLDITGDIRHIDNTNTKIAFTSNQIDFQAAGASRFYINNYGLYIESGRALAFLATGGGATPHIKSGGTNAQDLLFTTGSGNPTRLQIDVSGDIVVGDFTPVDTRNTGGIHIQPNHGISFKAYSSASDSRNWRIRSDDTEWGNLDFSVGDNNSTDIGSGAADAVLSLAKNHCVGINRTDPDQRLCVNGNAEFNAYDSSSGSGGYYTAKGLIIGNAYDAGKTSTDDRNAIIWNERGLDLDFATSDTLRMKIDHNGNIGMGEDEPNRAKLHVRGADSTTSIIAKFRNPSSSSSSKTKVALVTGYGDHNQDTEGHAYIGAQRNSTGNTTDLFFETSTGSSIVERLRIKSGGEVACANGISFGAHSGFTNTSTLKMHMYSNDNTIDDSVRFRINFTFAHANNGPFMIEIFQAMGLYRGTPSYAKIIGSYGSSSANTGGVSAHTVTTSGNIGSLTYTSTSNNDTGGDFVWSVEGSSCSSVVSTSTKCKTYVIVHSRTVPAGVTFENNV